jgi:hypothetical protein
VVATQRPQGEQRCSTYGHWRYFTQQIGQIVYQVVFGLADEQLLQVIVIFAEQTHKTHHFDLELTVGVQAHVQIEHECADELVRGVEPFDWSRHDLSLVRDESVDAFLIDKLALQHLVVAQRFACTLDDGQLEILVQNRVNFVIF